ncbi:MAG TPA: TonB-dependent receptor [Chitinophagaceae bacterium]|nr:TonB-dependent receptor [Chitinophagaceae bacterium]
MFPLALFLISTTIQAQQTLQLAGSPEPRLQPEYKTGSIQGRILTTDGQPAGSVSISLKELDRTTITDEQGRFLLKNLREGNYTVVVTMTGMQPAEKTVAVKGGETATVQLSLVENHQQLKEIIVTSQKSLNERTVSVGKIAVQPKDLPQSITIIDRGIIERQQVLTMSDVLQNVNGVYIAGTTGGYQEEIAARGYSFGSSNTFKNGGRFNNAIKPEMSSVEKVEVLKGGNAILYGNVGAGGVLNIITRKPKFETGGEVSFRAGSYDLYKPSFDIYGPFGSSRKVAFRLNGTYETAGSFRDRVSSERFYINPSFLFKLGGKTELLLEGDYLKDDRTPDFGSGAIKYQIADVPRSRFLNVPWAYLETEQATATATLTHKLGEQFSLRALASFQAFDNELFGAARPGSLAITDEGKWIRGLQRSATSERYGVAQVDLNGRFRTGKITHQTLVGADIDQYRTENRAYAGLSRYDSVNLFDPYRYEERTDIPDLTLNVISRPPVFRYGIYGQDLLSLGEQVKVLAGVRYSFQENSANRTDSVAKGKTVTLPGTSADAFSPRLGVVYQPAKWVSLFTSYTNTFTLNTGTDIYGQALAPSVIDQFELGVKNDLFGGKLTANVTAYRIVNSNLAQTALFQASGDPNNNSNIKELTGETTSKGVEVDLMTKSINGFQAIAGYSYNDMRYTGVNGNTVNGNKKGDRLRYNPAHTANASLFYHFAASSAVDGLYVGAGVFYTGDRLAGRNPTNSPTNTNQLMALPDFATVDLNAGYSLKQFTLRLKVSNLFNVLSYNAHDDNSINPIAPRQLLGTVAYKF